MILLPSALAFGLELTRTVAVIDGPLQPPDNGVMVNVVVCGVLVVFVRVPEILLLPLEAMPVRLVVFVRVQLYVVPPRVLLSAIVVIVLAEHVVWLEGVAVATGEGWTVMVNVFEDPVQPFADGVTVIVATTAVVPLFVAVKEAILPVPLAANPMLVLSLVQLNVVPVTAPVNVTVDVLALLQGV